MERQILDQFLAAIFHQDGEGTSFWWTFGLHYGSYARESLIQIFLCSLPLREHWNIFISLLY